MVDLSTEDIKRKIIERARTFTFERNYSILGLKFNPFPPAAIPRFVSLPPLNVEYRETIENFILATYGSDGSIEPGEYAGLTIAGEYGMGKSHLMLYLKTLIDELSKSTEKESSFSAVTCFIDRPEDDPRKVIHKIIEQIGLDTLRKYVWAILIDDFESEGMETFLRTTRSSQTSLNSYAASEWDQLFNEPVKSNYLEFLNIFDNMGGDEKRLQEKAREIINKKIVFDETLADRYLGLLFKSKKTDTSWEVLAGYINSRELQRKEVIFLNSIVSILKLNGFALLYVFVDEFEDISKLTRVKRTDYLLTLNTLINNQRKWAVIVSLTYETLRFIREDATPLYDRLVTYIIRLEPLNLKSATNLLVNYLNISRSSSSDTIFPFTEDLINNILKVSKGNYRSFIRLSYKIIERVIIHKDLYKLPLNKDILEDIRDVSFDVDSNITT